MPSVDTYKLKMGAGVRKNLYSVEFSLPDIIKDVSAEEMIVEMVGSVQMPLARKIEVTTIDVAGDSFKIATGKSAEEDITLKFNLEETMTLTNIFQLWMDVIQQDFNGVRTVPDVYKSPYFVINQLSHDGTIIKRTQVIGAFPTDMGRLENEMSEPGHMEMSVVLSIDAHKPLTL